MIVIVMGVSGSGKSLLATKLAETTHWAYAEGDDYHSLANKAKMHASIPLTDADRVPWLDSLHEVMANWQRIGQSGVLTCSSLKAAYRDRLAAGLPELRFIWLDPPREVLIQRLANRPGHFMSPALLDSQLATLEPPIHHGHLDPNTLRLDGSETPDQSVQTILRWLSSQPASR